MRTSVKVFSALSVAGLALVAGSAFTGAGLSTTGDAAAPQFIGGTVSQSVDGATLTDLEYGFVADGTQTAVNQVTLTFAAGANGKTAEVELTGSGTASFTCEAVGAVTTNVSVCTPTVADTTKTNVTSAAVTVS